MSKLLPECSKCASPVTDSLESEIEQHGRVKTGRYINGVWICHDCIASEEGQVKNDKGRGGFDFSSTDQYDTIGVASSSDVSPNTPKADEFG
jgi:hypothetical protein